jgi:hypothetical protein
LKTEEKTERQCGQFVVPPLGFVLQIGRARFAKVTAREAIANLPFPKLPPGSA